MKRLLILLTLAFSLLTLTACAPKEEDSASSEPLLVGYSQLGMESAFRLKNSESMRDAAAKHGVSLILENANQKQEKQIEAIRSFIAYQVDVITVAPNVESGWDNVLTEAKKAGIPVLLVDRMVKTEDDSLYACYIGSDFILQGEAAAKYLSRKADDLGAEHLNVVEISGTLGSTPMMQRQQGFMGAIAEDERFTVLESVSGDFLISKGRECMQYLLDKYGDEIDVLYSHNDGMTLGAIEVIEEAGLIPGRDILILSVDAEQAAIDLLREGKLNCVVECTPYLGDLVMQQAKRLAAGETVDRIIHPEEHVFTDYDDLSTLAPRGY